MYLCVYLDISIHTQTYREREISIYMNTYTHSENKHFFNVSKKFMINNHMLPTREVSTNTNTKPKKYIMHTMFTAQNIIKSGIQTKIAKKQ